MKLTSLIFCSLLFTIPIRAERMEDAASGEPASGQSLALGAVTSVVLAHNPAIREAFKKWNAARERIPQASAWDDPRVTADSVFRRLVKLPPNAMPDQSLMLEQMVPITGKNRSRARAAAAEALSSFEEVRRQQLDVLTAARGAYYRLANAYAQLEINRQNIVSLKGIAEASRVRFEVGNESAASVLVTEAEASQMLEAQRDLQRTLANGQSQLNTLMNRDAFAPLGIPAEATIKPVALSIAKLRALTLANRPELRMAQDRIEVEKSLLQLAHREWIPDPTLSVRATRYNDAAQGTSELSTGVSFSVPWVNYRKYSAWTREAESNLGAAQEGLDRAQKEALRLLRDQLQKVETAQHHVELFRDNLVPLAQQAFDATQLGYESAKSGFVDWLTAQRTLRDAQARAREYLTDYQIAVAELEGVIGVELKPTLPKNVNPKATSK